MQTIFCHSWNNLLTLAHGTHHRKSAKELSYREEEKEFVRFVSIQLNWLQLKR